MVKKMVKIASVVVKTCSFYSYLAQYLRDKIQKCSETILLHILICNA